MKARILELFEGQRGFAMVLALLITVIMTLLGMAFILMSQTENRIAENERTSAQALYFAEAGVRVVESWFNTDFPTGALMPPPAGAIDLTRREIDDDGDGPAPWHLQDGGTWPRYKQNVDLNFDGSDDHFLRPYRDPADLRHAFLGTPKGPDVRIIAAAGTEARTYLESLSEALVPAYPAGGGGGVRARISRIEIYAPPYVDLNGAWTRHGMATIAVEATILQTLGGTEQVLARRTVKAVLNEIPYYAARGPLQSGGPLTYNGDLRVHWGPLLAAGTGDLDDFVNIPDSHPRAFPGGLNVDLLWAHSDPSLFATYKGEVEGGQVPDPWFRYFGTGPILDAINMNVQPEPYTPALPFDPANPAEPANNSSVFQNLPLGALANFDYDLWKRIATSRRGGLHYYVWVDGSSFSENGYGPEKTFEEITDGQEGVFFFDTRDKKAPYDDDGDGVYDNLTPPIVVNGGTWGTRGLIFLNCERIQVKNVTGRPATFNAPGEVFQDYDADGQFDAGENWLNLDYPSTLGAPFVLLEDDALQDDGTTGGTAVRNRIGPSIEDNASVWGILYNSGTFDASGGNATFYGSVIADSGVVQTEPGTPAPDIYWDDRLPTEWPPPAWTLPRVAVARWVTE